MTHRARWRPRATWASWRGVATLVFAVLLIASVELPAGAQAGPDETRGRPGAAAAGPTLTMERAVAIALEQNRDVVAARLDIKAAELAHVAAAVYPNPILSYGVGNVALGAGNAPNQAAGAPVYPGFSQLVQTVGISDIIDVWAKRSAHIRAADRGIDYRKLEVEDALREIAYAVRSAFADLAREQAERELSYEVRDRYGETVRLTRARFNAGEISEAELRKIELEGLKYQSDVIDADAELDLTRQKLGALMGLRSSDELPQRVAPPPESPLARPLPALVAEAMQKRPDVLALREARRLAEATLSAARTDALPDISLGIAYTHSEFQVSGDNPNTLGVSVALPLPIFDRNQAAIGRANLDIARASNDEARVQIQVRKEVSDAVRRAERAEQMLALFRAGGMLERADIALRVAERAYRAGSVSLLELLEAQRTYLDTRAQYLRAEYDHRQSTIDILHAVGGAPNP